MKHELLIRKETRHIGKEIGRKVLTDTIRDTIPESKSKPFSYGKYTKLVYKHVLGTTVKKYKEQHNLPDKANIRDYFTIDTLQRVQAIESKIAGIIEYLTDDQDPYDEIKTFLDNNPNL